MWKSFSIVSIVLLILSCNEPKPISGKIFKFNLATGLNSLDPAFAKDMNTVWVTGNIFDCLVTLDENNQLIPQSILSYSSNKLSNEFTFHLRHNMYFHQDSCFHKLPNYTRKVVAQDWVYSLQRLIDPNLASPGAWVIKGHLDTINPFTIIDSFTFNIKLRHPYSQFIYALTMPYCSVIPHEAIELYGKDFRKNPVGTGPFQMKIWEEGTALVLKKNNRYFLKDSQNNVLPYLDYVKITFNEQKKTEFLSFKNKELDMISGLDPSFINEIFSPEGDLNEVNNNNYSIIKRNYLNTEYIAIMQKAEFIPKNSPLINKKIRQAIQFAINKKELVKYLKNNIVAAANKGFVAQGMTNYNYQNSLYTYDPDKAKALIAAAGYNSMNKPKLEFHINNVYIDIAEYISSQLEQVGFDVEIKLHPSEMMTQLACEGKMAFFRRSWTADFPDAISFFSCFYSKNATPPNYTKFSNPRFDQLYEKVLTEPNIDIRKSYYSQMERIIEEESPVIPLYYEQSIRLVQKNISGITQNSLNNLDLRTTKKN